MKIIEHPESFKEGVRILMRTWRNKEGGNLGGRPDRKCKKLVSRNPKEFDECFNILMGDRVGMERIYSSVDQRDMEKGIRIFKQRMLDSDYYKKDERHGFYIDVYNRWISSLQSPQARKEKTFMVDVDNDKKCGICEGKGEHGFVNCGVVVKCKNCNGNGFINEEDAIRKEIKEKGLELMHEYPTKNGIHFILKPFNPTTVSFDCLTNHMMLCVYEEEDGGQV